jgi:hypothetical protein
MEYLELEKYQFALKASIATTFTSPMELAIDKVAK